MSARPTPRRRKSRPTTTFSTAAQGRPWWLRLGLTTSRSTVPATAPSTVAVSRVRSGCVGYLAEDRLPLGDAQLRSGTEALGELLVEVEERRDVGERWRA